MELVKELPAIFEELEEQKKESFLEIKEYKSKGIPVIGAYCSYFPRELAMAVGAVPVGLCSSSNDTVAIAEKTLPAGICPLIKSSYGYAVSDKCPFYYFSDIIVGETTCDGKKKMYELLADQKEVYVMELPSRQSEVGLALWKQEVMKFKEYLEDKFRVIITEENLRNAVKISNDNRRALKDLYEVMKLDPPPIMGTDLFKVIYGSKYQFDFQKLQERIVQLKEKILENYEKNPRMEKKPRIVVTGCPMGGDSQKVIDAIEENGGVVVAFENCTGAKAMDKLVDESAEDICQAIAERYLAIGCAVMTPNDNRIELLGRLIDEYKADAVIEMVLCGCHSTSIESVSVRQFVGEEKHIPYMDITTDFSQADKAQLNTRISAFIEMIKEK